MRTLKPYTAICFFFCLSLFPLVFLSCGTMHEGSPCEAYECGSYIKYANLYGKISFKDPNATWLDNTPVSGKVKYSNGGGFSFNYTITKDIEDDKVTLRSYYATKDPCCPGYYYKDYYLTQAKTIFYDSKDGGFPIYLKKMIKAMAQLNANDSLIVDSAKEVLIFSFNYTPYEINTDTSFQSPQQIYHSYINLRNINYSSVFEIIDTKVDTNQILVKGYYISFTKGVIGYYLTNGELWLQE